MMNKTIKDLISTDRLHLWHPYTQMKDFEEQDFLFIDHADGVFLFDHQGRRYYDTISSWWCVVHGHCHPIIQDSIARQLSRLDQVHFAGTTHEPAIRLAKKIVDHTQKGLRGYSTLTMARLHVRWL
jgi:adenosylmethionine-8-amino-7-oxononanoate aminotransferase